ncbi:MAG: TnpV protein [Acutalibacteraceae bacterium]
MCLSGELWAYLADLNEQAQSHLELIIEQIEAAEVVIERMNQHDQMAWVGAMNNIRNRAEEIVLWKMIYEGKRGCFDSH